MTFYNKIDHKNEQKMLKNIFFGTFLSKYLVK